MALYQAQIAFGYVYHIAPENRESIPQPGGFASVKLNTRPSGIPDCTGTLYSSRAGFYLGEKATVDYRHLRSIVPHLVYMQKGTCRQYNGFVSNALGLRFPESLGTIPNLGPVILPINVTS